MKRLLLAMFLAGCAASPTSSPCPDMDSAVEAILHRVHDRADDHAWWVQTADVLDPDPRALAVADRLCTSLRDRGCEAWLTPPDWHGNLAQVLTVTVHTTASPNDYRLSLEAFELDCRAKPVLIGTRSLGEWTIAD